MFSARACCNFTMRVRWTSGASVEAGALGESSRLIKVRISLRLLSGAVTAIVPGRKTWDTRGTESSNTMRSVQKWQPVGESQEHEKLNKINDRVSHGKSDAEE